MVQILNGILQTWMYNKQVFWADARSAKMIGIAFTTFNGGTEALLAEFAKTSRAYQMKA